MSLTGWRSRGYLPHCDEKGLVQHIVFGLADALPGSVPSSITDPAARAEWADKAFDTVRGKRLLASRANAAIVQDSLLRGDGERYAIAGWCIMPTHVHVLVEQFADYPLAKIIHSWKSFTAHAINENEERSGALWLREYFDRFMRSGDQFAWTVEYIERNPVTAGLVQRTEDWEFSSARWRR